MQYNKIYQYKDITKSGPVEYSGTLALKLLDDTQYNVGTPVNKAINYQENKDVIILNNTLDSTSSSTMKFNLSFKVNKDVIGVGTRNILDFPGLLSVKSESNTLWFKFYYEDALQWKYVASSELVDGWNTVLFAGDGSKLTLTINNTKHTIIDSTLTKKYVTYTGGQYKYLKMDDTAPLSTADSWEIQTTYTFHKSGTASYPCIFGYSGGSDYKTPSLINEGGSYRLYMSSTGSSWDLNGSSNTGFNPEDGKTYDIYAGFENAQYYVKWRLFGETDWAGKWTMDSGTKVYCGVSFYWLNLSLNSYNYYNAGELYMSNTKIIIDGETWFDGATDTGFTNTDCTRKESTDGPIYPVLNLGTLKTYQSWLYLKDIVAEKVDAGSDTPTPPTYDDEGAPVAAKDLPKGWAMWKLDATGTDDTGTNFYRYTEGIPEEKDNGKTTPQAHILPTTDSTIDGDIEISDNEAYGPYYAWPRNVGAQLIRYNTGE